MRISIVGNCQAPTLGRILAARLPETAVEAHSVVTLKRLGEAGQRDFLTADILLAQVRGNFENFGADVSGQVLLYPRISFRGFHPDMVYVNADGVSLQTPFGFYHSAIAFAAHRLGLSRGEAAGLFGEAAFDRLGYFANMDAAKAHLLREGERCGFDLGPALEAWLARGCFMHTINHPKLFALETVADLVISRLGLSDRAAEPGRLVDTFAGGAAWTVYPEIAARLGLDGAYSFKAPRAAGERSAELAEFVSASFDVYDAKADAGLEGQGVDLAAYGRVFASLRGNTGRTAERPRPAASGSNPYRGLPPHQFWRSAVSQLAPGEVDPVVEAPFRITAGDRIASAGSCFAQHIARALRQSGYRYHVTEPGPAGLAEAEASSRGYGVFSARYGNLYTARQLLQLFDRAHGAFEPADVAWRRPDGALTDPFRPTVEPDGFTDETRLRADRDAHFAAVRRLFREADVFAFTLGLTEGWEARADGAVFPIAPGVAAGEPDFARYRFFNLTVGEVEADLLAFVDRLREVNPGIRIVLTVSPVPLAATYEPRSVVTATCYSKAVLRVAAETASRARPGIAYFPSFEIITGPFSRGRYYEDDCRNVTPPGVDHAMRLFLAHYCEPLRRGGETPAEDPLFDVICDEERLDAGL